MTIMESDDMLKKSLSGDPEVESEESLPEKKKSFWKKVPFIGLILILLKNVLAGISDIVTKKMTDIDPITLIFFRSTVILSLTIPWSIVKDQPPFPSGHSIKERGLQVLRCVLAGFHVLAAYFALQQMPLSVRVMILSLKPVFTIIFERIFLKVPVGVIEIVTIVVMMLGVVLVLQPPFLFNYTYTEKEGFESYFLVSTILVLISTALNSNVAIIIRYFRKLPVASLTSSREIVFVIITFSTIFLMDVQLKTPNLMDKLKIVMIGVFCLVTQSLTIVALKVETASLVAVVDRSSAIIIAVVTQIIFFDLIPNSISVGGMILVLLAGVLQSGWKYFKEVKTKQSQSVI